MYDNLAVLVDGDNISGVLATDILTIAGGRGRPDVVRVYADATKAVTWHDAAGFRLIHAGTGKNASDLLLTIEAMELSLSAGIGNFLIASSDGDFTHLAHRLREMGRKVTGVGEAKAPRGFRAACSEFVEIGARPAIRLVEPVRCRPTELDQKIREMIASHSQKGAGIRITDLGPKMHSCHGTRISTHPERTWRGYFKARPDFYDLDPKGPEAKVRFRPAAFSAAG